MDPEKLKEFRIHLEKAHTHAQRALDMLYQGDGPRRGFFYRVALGRAQSILIGLSVQENQRKKNDGDSD